MTKQVQRRRGTATQHTSFTGAEGELSVNTTNKSVHVHDGSTAGGIELARKDGSNVAFTSGTLDGVTIGGSTAGAGTFTNLTATGTTTLAGASTSANITFGDNDKAIFGAGSDLQIYHDGSNSYVAESGAGSLILGGSAGVFIKNHALDEFYIQAYQNGEVKLYYDNAAKLATTSTGIDVTGTVTADGLTVDGDVRLDGGASGSDRYLRFTEVFSSIQNAGFYFHLDGTDDDLYIGRHDTADTNVANDKPVIGIDRGTGDISFYEDTGTTAKFFWDASAEVLGLGTTSPNVFANTGMHIHDATTSRLHMTNGTTGSASTDGWEMQAYEDDFYILGRETAGDIIFYPANSEAMRIDSSGNVGIGTSSPSSNLTVTNGAYGGTLSIGDNAAGSTSVRYLQFGESNDYSIQSNANSYMRFYAGSTEAMRIDSSGNLLVGKTSNDNTTAGIVLRPNGDLASVRDGGNPLLLNRLTSDGDIALFRKDGSTVGSIGTYSSGLDIAGSSRGIRFSGSTIFPVTNAGGVSDNSVQLGYSGGRFKDLYLSGGVYLGGTDSDHLLDDYEEGTWTPILKANNGTKTWSYSAQTGKYTKIGDTVTAWFNIQLSSNGSGTDGEAYVDGLPFTNGTGFATYTVAWKQLVETSEIGLMLKLNNQNDYFWVIDGSSSYPDITYINTSAFTNDRRMRGQFTYKV